MQVNVLVRTDKFFGCGKSGHKVRDFPNARGQEKVSIQCQTNDPSSDSQRRNQFFIVSTLGVNKRVLPIA